MAIPIDLAAARWAVRLVLLALLLGAGAAGAQEEQRPSEAEATAPAPIAGVIEDEWKRGTPYDSVVGYLTACRAGDYEVAARYLHLGPVAPAERDARGPVLARQLKIVLDRELWVDVDRLSNDPKGDPDDGLPSNRDTVGTIETSSGRVPILIDRVPRGDGESIWKISPVTVAEVPKLYAEFGESPIEAALPSILVNRSLFDVALWQWLGILLVVLAAYVTAWLLAGLVARVMSPLVARSQNRVDDRLLAVTIRPIRLLITVGMFSAGSRALELAIPARRFFGAVEASLAIVGVAWLIFRLIDLGSLIFHERLQEMGKGSAAHFLPLGARTLKFVIGAIAFLAALDSFGFDVTAVIAGLGVGGIAVALAAQKTLENVFGGLTIMLDQPVRPGDFCRFSDRVGTVEEVGIRSTRIRTLDRTVVTVPNSEFSTLQLENFAMRDRIRLQTLLGLRYETSPEQLRFVLGQLRRLLHSHPSVQPETSRVRFDSFGDFSLNVEIWAYILTRDWNEYLAVREDLYLRMMDIVAEAGTGFAFPSQTAYIAKDDGLDAEKSEAAEAQVAEWRRQNELMFPDFSATEISAMDDTLDYPPEGSVSRSRS